MIIRCCLLLVLIVGFTGCSETPEIRQYSISKERSDLGSIGMTDLPSRRKVQSETRETRMFVAIAERESATWFFKVTGTPKQVASKENEWTGILKTIQFSDNDQPVWVLPGNWQQKPASGMRFATLQSVDPPESMVEISISQLGPSQNLLANVNRWRQQLGLPPINESELKLGNLEAEAGTLKTFDETGEMTTAASPMRPAPEKPADSPFTYDAPDGWTNGATSSIVRLRLVQGKADNPTQITVTQLLAGNNEWLPNAQRWATQAGMDSEPENMENLTEPVTIDGIEGKLISLISESEKQETAIVGAMIVKQDLAWFFKLVGSPENVSRYEKEFEKFIASFRFKK